LQSPDSEPEVALHSCKLHRGWIADIQFIAAAPTTSESAEAKSPDLEDAPWLISASNGGDVRIWDTSEVDAQDAFGCKASAQLHSNGIFSMHALPDASGQQCNLLTASKDGSVKLSCLKGEGSLTVIRTWANVHDGHVVKCVRWKTENIAASSGNDRCLPPCASIFVPRSWRGVLQFLYVSAAMFFLSDGCRCLLWTSAVDSFVQTTGKHA
jgi:WD40 repeat protein